MSRCQAPAGLRISQSAQRIGGRRQKFFSGQINFPERRPRAVCRNVKDQSKVESGKDLKECEQHSTRGIEEG